MKKNVYLVFTLIFLSILTVNVQGQTDKKLTKAEKKELKRQKVLEEKKVVVKLLESKKWIIEIEQFIYENDNGSSRSDPLRNFIGVNADRSINNLEGITQRIYEGAVENYEIIEGKERTQPSVKYHFQGSGRGSSLKADLLIVVNNEKMATIIMRYDAGGKITLRGRLVPWDKSHVFKEDY